jgi:hypothetical protein
VDSEVSGFTAFLGWRPSCLEMFSRSRRGTHGGMPERLIVGGSQLSGHRQRGLPLLISVFFGGVF